jgi:hypothetical protein
VKTYIGTKMIQAEPMTREEFSEAKKSALNQPGTLGHPLDPMEEGYMVAYSDGYLSWSPKDVFDKSYLEVTVNPELKTKAPSISQQMVDDFIDDVKVITLDGKTTVVRVLLKNGFTCVEASSCVSPENYDEAMGAKICMDRIKNQIWKLLGFLLQTAVGGVK